MLTIKEKIYRFDYIKFQNFCSIKDIMNKLKAQDTNQEKIFTTYNRIWINIKKYGKSMKYETYKKMWQINENMTKQFSRKMEKKFEQVSYENIINFIKNQGNTNKDHNIIISFHTYQIAKKLRGKTGTIALENDLALFCKNECSFVTLPPGISTLRYVYMGWPPSLGTQTNT